MTGQRTRFAKRLREGELLLGTLVTIPNPAIAEILAGAGFDWLFLDAEHGPFDPHDAQSLMQAAGDCPCAIRVPAHDEVWIKKALDCGAAAIIVPLVNNAEQAKRVVAHAKYAPAGRRGVGVARAQGFGMRFNEYLQTANEETAVIIQAEHRDAVGNIEAIVEVEGVDAVLIGPYDLSASYGKMGQLDDPEIVAAVDAIVTACRRSGVKVGVFGMDAAAVVPFIRRGAGLIAVGSDSLYLVSAAKRILADLHG